MEKKEKASTTFFRSEEGNIIVDFIGRFERINEDFDHITDRLNIQADLPHKNKSDHKDYKKYYSKKAKKMVREGSSVDLKAFGYNFEGIIEKNRISSKK